MNIEGFNLMLQDFCDYCGYFEPEVEKIECSTVGSRIEYMNNIRCIHMEKCVHLAKRMEDQIDRGMEK